MYRAPIASHQASKIGDFCPNKNHFEFNDPQYLAGKNFKVAPATCTGSGIDSSCVVTADGGHSGGAVVCVPIGLAGTCSTDKVTSKGSCTIGGVVSCDVAQADCQGTADDWKSPGYVDTATGCCHCEAQCDHSLETSG